MMAWHSDGRGDVEIAHVPRLHVRFETRRIGPMNARGRYEAWALGEGAENVHPPTFLLGHLGNFYSKLGARQVCEDWAAKIAATDCPRAETARPPAGPPPKQQGLFS